MTRKVTLLDILIKSVVNSYDTKAAQSTQMAIMSLQEGMDTITPIQSLNIDDSKMIGEERKQRLEARLEKVEALSNEKRKLKRKAKDPVSDTSSMKFLDELLGVNFGLVDESKHRTKSSWVSLAQDIILSESLLGESLAVVFVENMASLVDYITEMCLKKKSFSPKDPLPNYLNWLYESMDKLLGCENVKLLPELVNLKLLIFKHDIVKNVLPTTKKNTISLEEFKKIKDS